MMSQTVELPRLGGPGSGVGGLWRVIVLNDDHNTFDHVAETISGVIPECPWPMATAWPIASTAVAARSSGAGRVKTPSSTGLSSTEPA